MRTKQRIALALATLAILFVTAACGMRPAATLDLFPAGTTAPDLTVEEYAIVAEDVDAPGHFEYMQRVAGDVLQHRQDSRTMGAHAYLTATNEALAPFGYRLMNKSQPGNVDQYDLYHGDSVAVADLTYFRPPAINAAGDDFALVVDSQRGSSFLLRSKSSEPWDTMRHAYRGPVFVGNDLVSVERDEGSDGYTVRQGSKAVYRVRVGGPRVDEPVKGLWSWQGHWVLEVDGKVIVDGKSLNEQLGYEQIFNWVLLHGQPFYFFKKGPQIDVSYAGRTLQYTYDDVIHYRCCEPAAFNVGSNSTMVWFHAFRGSTWYYVEMGVY